MTNRTLPKLAVVAGGLVPLVLLFGVGCGDAVQSRANTGRTQAVKSIEPGKDTATRRVETSARSAGDASDKENSSEPPSSDKANADDDSTTVRPSATARK